MKNKLETQFNFIQNLSNIQFADSEGSDHCVVLKMELNSFCSLFVFLQVSIHRLEQVSECEKNW